ncbi:MAG TPA: hypothetical protein DCM45_07165 [Clostridiales bacterium]|nr:hypothetical protein [Clostridiales bacterium]
MKTQKFIRLLGLILCLSILGSLMLTGCQKPETDSKTVKYTIWQSLGDDSAYYAKYEDNPAIQYLQQTKTWGPDKKKIELEFLIPPAGTATDSFNTLLSTGDYPEMMDGVAYSGSVVDLYEQGIVLDLTDYIKQYMPNYIAFLEANPELAAEAYYLINGEKKYLSLRNFIDAVSYNWGGYCYRRDWIIKYGTNPKDGSAFSGRYTGTLPDGSVNMESWEDNVIFPSGGSDPVYISDWEWMLDIFAKAIADLGIKDGYPMSLYYPGFLATGDLVCSFGGDGPVYGLNKDNQVYFGATGENFRVYLQAMNTWFKNGWIDKAFTEHNSDMFFAIDDAKIRSGKVGLWWGTQGVLIGKLDDGEDLKKGMVVYGARQPINDIYGTVAQKNQEPYTMYQYSRANMNWLITDKMKEKDIVPLLTMIDYLYTEEGAKLCTLGLTKEQYEETKPELYTRFGLTEGSYYKVPDSEARGTRTYAFVDTVANDGASLNTVVRLTRFVHLEVQSLLLTRGSPAMLNSLDQWIWYENKGSLTGAILNQVTADEQKTISKTGTNVNEFMNKTIPTFIKGDKDPFSNADWEAYVKAINKYAPDKITKIYQEKLDNLNK